MINRQLRLGTAEIERLVCDPEPLGSVETLMPRVADAWSLEFPGLSSLPRYEGEPKPLKVCIATEDIVGPVRNGGIGTTYAALAELLAKLGIDTTVLYLKGTDVENGTLAQWVQHYAHKGVRFVPVPNYAEIDRFETGADRWLRNPYNMMRYLLDYPMDVVHVSEWRGSGYLSLLAKKQGLAFRDTLFIVKTSSPWMWNRLYGSQPLDRLEDLAKVQSERRSVEYADLVIGGSLHLLKWMASQGYDIPRARTFVQPNVVTFEHLKGLISKRQSEPGSRRKIDEIVFFGRLEARKGLFTFVQAIKRLIRLGVTLPPTISFMGKAGARLTARPDQEILDYIAGETASWPTTIQIHTEFQQYEALEYLLSGERLAVMPSMIENSSLAVYEAAMCGIPFVASASGGTPELIAPEDHEHVLCDAHPLTLADKIAEAIDEGGYIAHPNFDNDQNLEEWRRFHLDLSRGLREHLLKPPVFGDARAITVSVCIYYTGEDERLETTLNSLAAQTAPAKEIVVAIDADDMAAMERARSIAKRSGLKAEFVEAYDFDAGLAFNKAAEQTNGDFLLFLWAGSTLKPEALLALAKMERASGADVISYFYRVVNKPARAKDDHLRATLFTNFTESFFRTDLTALPLFVRREVFRASSGFSYDYRVLGSDHEFAARAMISGYHCETVLLELGTVPEWDTDWLRAKCYDQSIGQFRAVRPHLAAAPLAMRELMLMAKGLQVRGAPPTRTVWSGPSGPYDLGPRGPLGRLLGLFTTDVMNPKLFLRPTAIVFDEVRAKEGYKEVALVAMSNRLQRFQSASGRVFHGEVVAVRNSTIYGWLRDEARPGEAIALEVVAADSGAPLSFRVEAELPLLIDGRSWGALKGNGFSVTLGGLRRAMSRKPIERVALRVAGEDLTIAELDIARPGLNLEKAGLEGYCDENDLGSALGWVWSPTDPKRNFDVAVFIDGLFYSRVSANATRDDLIAAHKGEGHYGFRVQIPRGMRDGRAHVVESFVADHGLLLKRGKMIARGDHVMKYK